MHSHLEVIMPPTEDVDGALNKILDPFDENSKDALHAFWDWWQIGGRYSGSKAEDRLPAAKLEEFHAWLKAEKVTVSGLRAGKHELCPANQIPNIDAKWQEVMGVTGPCTLFKHAGDTLPGDICSLKDAMDSKCYRVIIAGPSYDGGIEASFMIAKESWNGVTHVDSTWDGKIASAILMFEEKTEHYKAEWRDAHLPKPDWLAVTVDYHK